MWFTRKSLYRRSSMKKMHIEITECKKCIPFSLHTVTKCFKQKINKTRNVDLNVYEFGTLTVNEICVPNWIWMFFATVWSPRNPTWFKSLFKKEVGRKLFMVKKGTLKSFSKLWAILKKTKKICVISVDVHQVIFLPCWITHKHHGER